MPLARLPVVHGGVVDGRHWLLVRRCLDDPTELAYSLVWAPLDTPLPLMVQASGARWHVEEDLEATKDLGLDHYEVRSYLGWYRHLTLVLLAYAFLLDITVQNHLTTSARSAEPAAGAPLIPLSTSEARHEAFPPDLSGAHLRATDLSVVDRIARIHQYWAGYYHRRRRAKAGYPCLSSQAFLLRSVPGNLPGSSPGKFPGTVSGKCPEQTPGSLLALLSFLLHSRHERRSLMTFVSVAEATTRLGVDAKTLHRWLAEAQLSLQSHPHDGRKKGVSDAHLQALARLHQRSLAPLPQEPPAPVPGEGSPLPAALLALPERLSTLQGQIAALQQQIVELTRLLQQQRPASATPVAPVPQTSTARRSSTPALPAPRSRPATSATAKPPRKPAHVIPRVEYGSEGHYAVICPKQGRLPFEPDTPEWFAWVAKQDSFRFVGRAGHFTAHHEWRVPRGAWRAHRHIRNHGYVLRLAPTHELTLAVLEQAAAALQAHLM